VPGPPVKLTPVPLVVSDRDHMLWVGGQLHQRGKRSSAGGVRRKSLGRKGINAGKLEYREGAIYGNPYLRVLRSQLEAYVVEELGDDYLRTWQEKTELQEIKSEMTKLRKRLDELAARQAEISGRH